MDDSKNLLPFALSPARPPSAYRATTTTTIIIV